MLLQSYYTTHNAIAQALLALASTESASASASSVSLVFSSDWLVVREEAIAHTRQEQTIQRFQIKFKGNIFPKAAGDSPCMEQIQKLSIQ
jgi:hypothetical protein